MNNHASSIIYQVQLIVRSLLINIWAMYNYIPLIAFMKIFKNHSPNNSEFMPHNLELIDQNKKAAARETVVHFLNQAIDVSNSNLMRNANTLIMSAGSSDKIIGLNNNNPKVSQKFKVTY